MRTQQSLNVDNAIITLYNKNLPLKDIASELGLTLRAVSKRMEKMDYEIRDRAYPIPEFWLEESKEMMYILGYIFADGNVSTDTYSVTLASMDIDHLEKVGDFLGKGVRIGSNKLGVISIGGKLLGKFLEEKYGLVPRKSKVVQFPASLPQKFLIPFLRGYFDGNGWVVISKEKKVACGFSSGSMDFLRGIANYLAYSGIDNPRFRNQVTEWGQSCSLTYGGVNRLRKLRNVLYEDPGMRMNRKYEKFMKI